MCFSWTKTIVKPRPGRCVGGAYKLDGRLLLVLDTERALAFSSNPQL
jgi:hypothetical protein